MTSETCLLKTKSSEIMFQDVTSFYRPSISANGQIFVEDVFCNACIVSNWFNYGMHDLVFKEMLMHRVKEAGVLAPTVLSMATIDGHELKQDTKIEYLLGTKESISLVKKICSYLEDKKEIIWQESTGYVFGLPAKKELGFFVQKDSYCSLIFVNPMSILPIVA